MNMTLFRADLNNVEIADDMTAFLEKKGLAK
jgi:hypothetical protein